MKLEKSEIMHPTVYYFEIPVNDLERAITFYSAVFGCEFDRVDVDGNQMANFPSLEGLVLLELWLKEIAMFQAHKEFEFTLTLTT
jgi:catechol 2,3-dioxygenase-like lactoylglutathione lyase family enzyme